MDNYATPGGATHTALSSFYNSDPEVQVLCVGDIHIGCRTPNYSNEIALAKLGNATKITLLLRDLYAAGRPVNKLVIFLLGDNIHGERVGQQMSLDEYGQPVREQIYVASSALVQMVKTLAPAYSEGVEVYAVYGTHGRLGKMGSEISNWESFLYDSVSSELKGVAPVIYGEDFYQIVEVGGKKFLLFHGDNIPCQLGVPYYGIDRRVTRYKESLGAFDYAVMGHFHAPSLTFPSGIPVLVNGAAVYGSNFPLSRMGLREVNKWWTFLVHPNVGVTNMCLIDLNYKSGGTHETKAFAKLG